MTPKTDLTEHHDFWKDALNEFDIGHIIDNEWVTPEEWNAIWRHEEMWGKKRHDSQSHEIFDDRMAKEMESRCARCGAEFRLPWKISAGGALCIGCENIVSHHHYNLPWNATETQGIMRDDYRGARDLFNLR